MSNSTPLKDEVFPKFILPLLALVLAIASPVVGAIIGVFALKQIADRQTKVSSKRLARASMALLAAFAAVYIGVAVILTVTGYDLFP